MWYTSHMTFPSDVLRGDCDWSVVQSDAGEFLDSLPPQSIDLIFSSPPYEKARLYLEDGTNLGIARDTEQWVAWMVDLTRRALRATRGVVCWVVEGQTSNYSYSGSPLLLQADLIRAGITLRKPPLYVRDGIPGSGGPDWLKNKYEFIVCATNGGRLPWSDNTAMGTNPIYAVGGACSNRTADGRRINKGVGNRLKDGRYNKKLKEKRDNFGHSTDGSVKGGHARDICEIANPGNLIHCGSAGGGNISRSDLAHDNEAPFPEALVEFFVKSFCPPGGITCDPFFGSGTTLIVSQRYNRKFVGCDLRASQVELSKRRLLDELGMFRESVAEEEPISAPDLFA
jgi:DNA modification methylase